jgi:hypothetical protein
MRDQTTPGLPIVTLTYVRGADKLTGASTTVEHAVICAESKSKNGDDLVHFVPLATFKLDGSSVNPQSMKTASSRFGAIVKSASHGLAIN